MSYILEALKKSSDERSRLVCVAAPDGRAWSDAGRAPRRSVWWPAVAVGIGALAVIAFVEVGLVRRDDAPLPTHAETAAPIVAAALAPAPEPTDPAPATAKTKARPAQDPSAPPSPPSAPPADAAPPPKKLAAKPAPREIPTAPAASGSAEVRGEMPPALLQQVLAIPISAHIYSSKPAERMVIIDGRAVREGGSLPSGVLVEQITPDGIAVSFQGYRANRPVH